MPSPLEDSEYEHYTITPQVTNVLLDSVTVFIGDRGHGSGTVVTPDGIILTARHVLSHPEVALSIRINASGHVFPALATRSDPNRDVGWILFIPPDAVDDIVWPTYSELGDTGPSEGDFIFTIGTPIIRENFGSVSLGMVSAWRDLTLTGQKGIVEDTGWKFVMQTDAMTFPGCSGGGFTI